MTIYSRYETGTTYVEELPQPGWLSEMMQGENIVVLGLFIIIVFMIYGFAKSNRSFIVKNKSTIKDNIVFKSNSGAFEYACNFLNNDIEPNKALTGIVVDKVDGESVNYYVKYANSESKTVPTKGFAEMLDGDDDISFIIRCYSLNHVPSLNINDLVLVLPTAPKFAGVIVEKIHPSYNFEAREWVIVRSN
jgi:hypothetical protein